MILQDLQPLAGHHSTAGFDCGDTSINRWLHKHALANQRSGATRTFVICATDESVKAYVALAAGSISKDDSPGWFRRNMPDPIPVVILGRLGVDQGLQGQGIARALMRDTFELIQQVRERIGVRGILVHPASERAKNFWCSMGFRLTPKPNTLLVPLPDLALYPPP